MYNQEDIKEGNTLKLTRRGEFEGWVTLIERDGNAVTWEPPQGKTTYLRERWLVEYLDPFDRENKMSWTPMEMMVQSVSIGQRTHRTFNFPQPKKGPSPKGGWQSRILDFFDDMI